MTDGQVPALYSEQAFTGRQHAGCGPHALPKADEGFHCHGWLTVIDGSTRQWSNVSMLSIHYQIYGIKVEVTK